MSSFPLLPPRAAGSARATRRAACFALALIALVVVAPFARAQTGVQFDGSNDYVTFGAATSTLGTPTFTLECWFKRTGAGVSTSTGTGGVTNAIPLLTKGRGEAEASTVDCNYFMGIRASDSVLVADYEEGTGQASPGLNHPVVGVTPLARNVWYHAAATFDGTTWRLFLNGRLETTLVVGAGRLPQWASIQHAGLATGLTSTGAAAGYFAGTIDEARIWNHARPQAGIRDSATLELASAPGLLGRWGLNDGTGTTAANSVAGAPAGTLTNGPTWAAGSPFSLEYALELNGTNAYVNFGDAPALRLPQWTVECWFRRDGAGQGTDTGTGGVQSAVPLLCKGHGELDSSTVNVNYFLGIETTTGLLVGDFEESDAGASPSLNHPLRSTTVIANGAWHHAAVTYDGTTFALYLDGFLEGSLVVGQPSGSDGTHPVAIGSGLDRNGTAEGFFDGAIDEARIWDHARTAAEIASGLDARLTGTAPGLVARWGLDEAAGGVVASTAGTPLNGTIAGTIGTGWNWTGGAPFDLGAPTSPEAPTALAASAVSSTAIHLAWTDVATNESRYVVERSTAGSGGPFTPRDTLVSNSTGFDDTGLAPLTEYCYRVHAENGAGSSSAAGPACATTSATPRTALDFAGSTYVGFGDPAALDLAQFTVECWFRRDGTGATTTTGTGGVTDAIPLVTKGRGESEASNVDLNWFLGISDGSDVLCADFEEGAGGASPSLNHPVYGTTPITTGVWHHAAVTYDGTTWNLYLDGNLERTLAVNQPCASASTQQAALGSALTSTGVAAGYLDGALDEVRVWNVARTLPQIRGTLNAEIDVATSGLVARWGLDEASGTAVAGSAGTAVNGTITGSNYAWVPPAPFDLGFNDPPALPALVGPLHGAAGVPRPPSLQVQVSDPDADSVVVTWYGRRVATGPGPDFTLVGLPDTQYYTGELNGGSNAILRSQLDWVVANRASRNIAYVLQVGDCVEHGDNGGDPVEWMRADSSWARLEDPATTGLAQGIPYGICVGNHDQSPNGEPADGSTGSFNQHFGATRFAGRDYYGGHAGTNNDNWFDLFSAGGMDFLCVSLEYDTAPDTPVLHWADSLLKAYPGRRAILASHWLVNSGNPGTLSAQGQVTLDSLADNPNLFLMLCGHVPGEGRRSDVVGGHTVHTLLADYQSRSNGGGGLLRVLEFSPANNVIRVRTYSPWTGTYETDADSSSQFTLAYDMSGAAGSFAAIGSTKVASGETAALAWDGLEAGAPYEWYVTVSDGQAQRTGPTWGFTTAANSAPVVHVVAPDGGETLEANTTVQLRWTATDDAGVTGVTLLLSRTGAGGTYETLFTGLANTGSQEWLVTGPATANACLKVVATDAGSLSGEDVSDAVFAITAGATAVGGDRPLAFALAPARPNPAVAHAVIAFAVPREAPVRITVHDVQGREVARIADRVFAPGRHELAWDGRTPATRAAGGLYFVRMRTPDGVFTRRLALLP